MSEPRFEIGAARAEPPESGARWFAVRNGELLVRPDAAGSKALPTTAELGVHAAAGAHYVGRCDGVDYWATAYEGDEAAFSFAPLRPLHAALGDPLWVGAGRAVQLVEWAATHRYCGRCGTPTAPVPGERAMGCPECGLHSYPRLSPAVIMVVHRGDEMLLARGARFGMPIYSALAGFVEPGESLEDAVAREVKEEVGVDVHDIRYFASQPWPFPNSLMIGFYAAYRDGEIDIDPLEIIDAQWYRPDALPHVPGPPSIAGQLIDGFVRALRSGATPR